MKRPIRYIRSHQEQKLRQEDKSFEREVGDMLEKKLLSGVKPG